MTTPLLGQLFKRPRSYTPNPLFNVMTKSDYSYATPGFRRVGLNLQHTSATTNTCVGVVLCALEIDVRGQSGSWLVFIRVACSLS